MIFKGINKQRKSMTKFLYECRVTYCKTIIKKDKKINNFQFCLFKNIFIDYEFKQTMK